MTIRWVMGWILAGWIAWPAAHAHDVDTPRALLVLRDGGHMALTLHIDVARALHGVMQPQASALEFLTMGSALPPESFAREWGRATAQWSRSVRLEREGVPIAAERWRWPTATQAQDLMRSQLMHTLTGGGADHPSWLVTAHADFKVPLAATPDSILSAKPPALELRLPAALRPLTLTTQRPRHTRVAPGDGAVPVSF